MPKDSKHTTPRTRVQSFYQLAKPGIVYGNAMHILATALFAAAASGMNWLAVAGALVGVSLVIGSACVVNCIMDRFADAKMERTKHRPLPRGEVSVRAAVWYAILLAAVGVVVIALTTNWVVMTAALACHFTYTVVYGYVKRHSWVSTMVGTIPGTLPAVAGYAAIDPTMPLGAWLLALLILVWQLPHFYALSLYRRDDYAKSGFPMISVVKSRKTVTTHIIVTALLYGVVATSLLLYAPIHVVPGGILFGSAAAWVVYVLVAKQRGSDAWARKVFGTSLYMPMAILLAGITAVALG